jgi:regulator of protease activity HflC (stomatin/prohibitin superfamily)
LIIVLIILATSSFVIVESGHVGVVRTLGAVQPTPLTEGFHFKKPFIDKIEQVDVRLTKAQSKSAAASKDLQTVETQVTVQYSLMGPTAPETFQKIGNRDVVAAAVIEPAIQESVKAITAQYTAEQLVTKRAEVKLQIQQAIDNFIDVTLKDKSVPAALKISNVAITDFEFSAEFNRAIELKVKA